MSSSSQKDWPSAVSPTAGLRSTGAIVQLALAVQRIVRELPFPRLKRLRLFPA
jgi:hypothetical protein